RELPPLPVALLGVGVHGGRVPPRLLRDPAARGRLGDPELLAPAGGGVGAGGAAADGTRPARRPRAGARIRRPARTGALARGGSRRRRARARGVAPRDRR